MVEGGQDQQRVGEGWVGPYISKQTEKKGSGLPCEWLSGGCCFCVFASMHGRCFPVVIGQ